MRKFILPAIGLFAGGAIVYAGLMWLLVWRYQVTTEDAYVQADIAVIAPKIAGNVVAIRVTDNQRVKAGDILLELDTSDIKPKVDAARALVESRKAAISTLDARTKLQQAVIRQAQASLSSANSDAARARSDAARYRELGARGYVSKQRVELARADIDKADAASSKASAAIDAERGQLPVLRGSRDQAEADLKQAQAQLAQELAELEDAVLKAPFDGVVGNRTAQEGQFIRAGVQVMAIVPLPDVYVVANFKETQIGEMKAGQRADVAIDALPGVEIAGTIESFAPASGSLFSLLPPENATGNFTKIVQRIPVRIRLDGDTATLARLRAGMSVGVTVDIRTPNPAAADGSRK